MTNRMNNRPTRLPWHFALAALAMPLSSLGQDVQAKPDRLQIEEVVVTAQKKSESKQDVPMSIQVTTAEMLSNYQISDMTDIAKLSPGLDFGSTRNALSAVIKMRGVGQDGVSSITGPAVVTFEDGLAQLDVASSIGTLLDIERIEVLRGPQGTLYGQNAPAGVLNIFTKRPHFEGIDGYVEATHSGFSTSEVKGAINFPLVEDVLAMRLAAFNTETEGEVKNVFLDRSAEAIDRSGGRMKVLWLPNEQGEVTFHLSYSDTVSYGAPFFFDGPEALNNSEESVALIGVVEDFDLFDRLHFSNVSGKSANIQSSAAVSIEWDFGAITVNSNSQYQASSRLTEQDTPATPQDDYFGVVNDDLDVFAQEIRFSNSEPGEWEYVAGVFYRSDTRENFTPVILKGDTEGSVVVTADVETETLDFFGNLTWMFSERWNFSAGIRVTDYEATSIIFSRGDVSAKATFVAETVTGVTIPNVIPGNLEPGVSVSLSSEPHPDPHRNDKNVSGSIKVRHFFDDDAMAYLALDTGYRVGGFTVGVSNDDNADWRSLAKYEDETSRSLELGYKSTLFDGRVQFNAAVFYQQYEDFQIGVFPGAAPNKPITAFTATMNAEEATGKGGELELMWLVSENWDVSAGLAVAEVIADKFTRDICTPTEPRESEEQSLCDHSGANVNSDPKYYANFTTQYHVPIESIGAEYFARLLVSGKSDRDLIVRTARLEELSEAYATADLNMGLRAFDQSWVFSVWAKNIFDEEYVTSTPGLRPAGDGSFVEVGRAGASRTLGATVKYEF